MITEISFIVPTLNEEKYIENCIKSIHTEMEHYHYNYEVIVVDNGSTDKTNDIARENNASIVFETKKGIPAARQKGFQMAIYDTIAFIDADAVIPWGWLELALESLDDPRVVAVSGPLKFYDAPHYVNSLNKNFYYPVQRALHYMMPTIQGGNFVVKRWALQKIGGFDCSFIFWGEDTRTAVQLNKIGKVVLNPKMFINTSGRRLTQDGVFKTVNNYVMNYFSTSIFGAPVTHKHKDFR